MEASPHTVRIHHGPKSAARVVVVDAAGTPPVRRAPPALCADDLVSAGISPAWGEGLGPDPEPPAGVPEPDSALPDHSGPPGLPAHAGWSSWGAALSSGAWAAVRELGAQSTGAFIGLTVRSGMEAAGTAATAAGGTIAAAVMGAAALRAANLVTALACPHPHRARTAVRVALAAAPIAVAAAGVAWAAQAGTLASAAALLSGKLVQRCVRDFCSTNLAGVLPSSEVVDGQGQPVPKASMADEDWGRAVGNLLPTFALFGAQEFLAPAPAAAAGLAGMVAGLRHVAGTGLVESGRSLTGTLLTAQVAHGQGRHLQAKAGGGWALLRKNLASSGTLRHAADATAMRQSIGILADTFGMVAGRPTAPPLRRIVVKLLRAQLKALGEFRAPLVTRGQLALQQGRTDVLGRGDRPGSAEPLEVLGEDTGITYDDFHRDAPHGNDTDAEAVDVEMQTVHVHMARPAAPLQAPRLPLTGGWLAV